MDNISEGELSSHLTNSLLGIVHLTVEISCDNVFESSGGRTPKMYDVSERHSNVS